jgi:hypothetical protein
VLNSTPLGLVECQPKSHGSLSSYELSAEGRGIVGRLSPSAREMNTQMVKSLLWPPASIIFALALWIWDIPFT